MKKIKNYFGIFIFLILSTSLGFSQNQQTNNINNENIESAMLSSCNINAGGDLTFCFGIDTIHLNGSSSSGFSNISWVRISGPGAGNFSNPNSLISSFGNSPFLSIGTHTFEVSGECNGIVSTDIVVFTIMPPVTQSIISDISGPVTVNPYIVCTQLQLFGNAPGAGETGVWSSTAGVNFTQVGTSMTSFVFPGKTCIHITFYYTISNGGCSSTDTINVTFERGDNNVSIFGGDKSLCANVVRVFHTYAGCNATETWTIIPPLGVAVPTFQVATNNFIDITFLVGGQYQIIYNVVSNGVCPGGADTVTYDICISPGGIGGFISTTYCDSFPDSVFLSAIFNPAYTYGPWYVSSANGSPPITFVQTGPGQAIALINDKTPNSYQFRIDATADTCQFPDSSIVICNATRYASIYKAPHFNDSIDTLNIYCQAPNQFFRPRDYISSSWPGWAFVLTATQVPTGCTNIIQNNSYSSNSFLDFSCEGTYLFRAVYQANGCMDTMEWVVNVATLQKPSAGSDATIRICDNDTVPLVGSAAINILNNLIPNVLSTWTQIDANPPVTFLGPPSNQILDVTGFSVVGTYMFEYSFSKDSNCYLADTMLVIVDSCDTCQPMMPENLSCKQVPGGQILSWASLSIGISGYEIEVNYNDPLCCNNTLAQSTVIMNPLIPTSTFIFIPSGTCFSWRVRSACPSGAKSIWSSYECSCAPLPCDPKTPVDLWCEQDSGGQTLNWFPVFGISNYEIEIIYNDPLCCNNGLPIVNSVVTVSGNSFYTGPFSQPCFSWRVRSVCLDGTVSPWSVTECSCPPCDPEIPVDLRCKPIPGGGQMLTWSLVSSPTATYILEINYNDPDCCKTGVPPTSIQVNIPAGTNFYTMAFAYPCFSWRVRSVCPDGTVSPWSVKVCSCPPCDSEEPINLRCKPIPGGGQMLSWSPIAGVSYILEINYNDPACCNTGIPPTGAQFNLPAGTNFFSGPYTHLCFSWKVRSVCPDGTVSPWSVTVCSCPPCDPEIPVDLRCKPIPGGGQVLSWALVSGANYILEINYNDPDCCNTGIPPTSIQVNIPAGTNFYTMAFAYPCFSWRVRSVCSDGNISQWSVTECSCPPCDPEIPVDLWCEPIDGGQSLNWAPVSSPTATYILEINYNDPDCCNTGIPPTSIHIPLTGTMYSGPYAYPCFSWRVRSVCPDENLSQWSATECSCLPMDDDGETRINVKVTPNPTKDYVNFSVNSINGKSKMGTLIISSITGEIALTTQITLNGNSLIDLSHLSSGVYNYKIISNDVIKTGKVIVSK